MHKLAKAFMQASRFAFSIFLILFAKEIVASDFNSGTDSDLLLTNASCRNALKTNKVTDVKEENKKEVVLTGLLNSLYFYGSPSYGEAPLQDQIESVYILSLHQPLNFESESPEDGKKIYTTTCLLQIYSGNKLIGEELVGKNVKIKAKSFLARTTGHHRAPLIAEILDINLLN